MRNYLLFKRLMAIFLAMVLCVGLLPASALAKEPVRQKSVSENKDENGTSDGTYKIELSVTGDADLPDTTPKAVNVLIVYDISESMSRAAAGEGVTGSRGANAERVLHGFLNSLLTQQTNSQGMVTVNTALVTFGASANRVAGWNELTSEFVNRFGGSNGNAAQFTYNSAGTNWEDALQQAEYYLGRAPQNPTFVILLTDGAPTAHVDGGSIAYPRPEAPWTDYRSHYYNATDEARHIQTYDTVRHTFDPDTSGYIDNTQFYAIYAYGNEANLLDDLMYYANTGTYNPRGDNMMSNPAPSYNYGATDEVDGYYSAVDTSALQGAIDRILELVLEAMGITEVSMSDGTTSHVTAGTETYDLLDIEDPSGFEYFLTIPFIDGKFTDNSGNVVTVSRVNQTAELTWGDNNKAVFALADDDQGSGSPIKVKWTGEGPDPDYPETNFYPAPPEASKNEEKSSVDWNLSELNVLLSGVTYTVAFDVWPSQETLDMIADIKNDADYYNSLPQSVKDCLSEDGKLKTNTTATLKYKDNRDNSQGEVSFNKVEPQQAQKAEMLTVSKEWENDLDSRKVEKIDLHVYRDGQDTYLVKLSKDEGWTEDVFISIGIMRTNGDDVEILTTGHDFTFAEPENLTYHWELNAPTVHPMLIDGTVTMLIKVDAKHPAPEGATIYKLKDSGGKLSDYYVAETGAANLKAFNERRSSIRLKKVVEGEDAPEGASFPFTFVINNSLAPKNEPENDPKHASDYWVWFSVFDKNGEAVNDDGVVVGAEPEEGATGYYYAPSGKTVTIQAKDGYRIQVSNLPTGSAYSIEEKPADMPQGFKLGAIEGMREYYISQDTEITPIDGSAGASDVTSETKKEKVTEDAGTVDLEAQKITGKVDYTNSLYIMTFTNSYGETQVDVTKRWDDADDQDGIRPESVDVYLIDNDTNARIEGVDPLTLSEDIGWEGSFSNLPKYIAGKLIAYAIEEVDVTGYVSSIEGDAETGFTITNSHTPETININVEKKWDERVSEDKLPDSVSVFVYQLGDDAKDPIQTIELSKDTDWKGTFSKLKATEDEKLIEYSVGEVEVAGYEAAITGDAETGFVVTNTHETGTLIIMKTFEGISKGLIPAVQFVITDEDGNEYTRVAIDKENDTVEKLGKDVWQIIKKIEDVPTGDYTVSEVEGTAEVPRYKLTSDTKLLTDTATVVKDGTDGTVEAVIKNIYELLPSTLTVTKEFKGDITPGLIPENFEITLTGEDNTITLNATDKTDGKFQKDGLTYTWTVQAKAGVYKLEESGTDVSNSKYSLDTATYAMGADTKPVELKDASVTVEAGKDATLALINTYKYDKGNDNPPSPPKPPALNSEDHFYYVEGYPDGLVHPQGNITRAETATMIYRLLTAERRDEIFTDQSSFSDMDKSLWYNKAVSSMAKGEYIDGYPDGTFKGNNSITRAEFVTIVARFLENKATGENPFDDINGHWAKDYILAAVEAGWVDGYPDVTFKPDQPITRAEAMKIINSVLNRGVNETSKLGNFFNFPDNEDTSAWYYYEVLEAINDHEYTGKRPNENWTRNAVDYVYDIEKYERP